MFLQKTKTDKPDAVRILPLKQEAYFDLSLKLRIELIINT